MAAINQSVLEKSGINIKGRVCCPACHKVAMYVYTDADGELNYKCPSCHRKSVIYLKSLAAELLEKEAGAINKSFIPGKSLRAICCGYCKRSFIYMYYGATGHINMRCKCSTKLLVDLDNHSSSPL